MATRPGSPPPGGIVGLEAGDLPLLEQLLTENGLPADDCAAPGNRFFGVFDGRRLLAAGGLETAGPYCLLRSLVVRPEQRGRGLARALTHFLLEQARREQHRSVYLLTETAARYFERFGFAAVPRGEVPAPIAATRQFAELCPDSADCMMLPLPAP